MEVRNLRIQQPRQRLPYSKKDKEWRKDNLDFSKEQVVLFSPATSSFDQFKNFEDRGRIFKELTNQIIGDR